MFFSLFVVKNGTKFLKMFVIVRMSVRLCGRFIILFFFRASLDKVYFPSVTLCNINQGRRSFFLQNGLNEDGDLLHAVLGQAYFGLEKNLTEHQLSELQELFSSEEVMRKGIFTDLIYMQTTSKARNFVPYFSYNFFLRAAAC